MAGALDWQQQQQCQHQWMPPRVCSQLHNSTARQCMRSFHGALRQWEVAGQQWVQEAVQQDRLHSTKALSKTAADSPPPPHTHTRTHPSSSTLRVGTGPSPGVAPLAAAAPCAGIPLELIKPEALRHKVFEPLLLLGKSRFSFLDIRIRVKGGGHVSQLYGEGGGGGRGRGEAQRGQAPQQWGRALQQYEHGGGGRSSSRRGDRGSHSRGRRAQRL
jgi:hypothetical protein